MTHVLFDTHAHLDFPKLQQSFEEVLEAARQNGVQRIVTIGASRGLESNYRALEIAKKYDHIQCTAGIHPHDADMATQEIIDLIDREFSTLDQVVGIGETGLDYYYQKADRNKQLLVFREFLKLSKRVSKPVIIHSRDAEEDTWRLLEEEDIRGGILHCFTGSRAFAEKLLTRDFYISFSGIVTFKNGRELLEIARDIPNDKILVETDSPYLAPTPYRGKTNQPAYVMHTASKIAEIKDMTLEAFSKQCFENACRVYQWPAQ